MKEFIDKLIEILEEDIRIGRKSFEVVVEIVIELAEEYKVSEMPTGSEGFCEWKKGKSSVFPIKTNCGNSIDINYGYEFCPYCGKKIMVAPYTEGETELYRAKSVDGEYQEYKGDWK